MVKKTKDFKPFFLYPSPRKKMIQEVCFKKHPDSFLWGLNYLVNKNYESHFSDIAYTKFSFLHWPFLPLEKYLIKKTGTGFKLHQAFLLLPKMLRADVVIAVGDSVALPVAFLKWLGILKTPLVHISMGLASKLKQKKTSQKIITILNKIVSSTDKIIFLSKLEKDLALEWLKIDERKAPLLPFGIDIDFFEKNLKKKNFILAIGRDKSRDYKTLFKAAERMPDQRFVVVTSRRNVKNLIVPDNLKIISDISYAKARELYLQAKFFVHPIKETYRGAAQTSFLEALTCHLPVVVADTMGMKEYGFKNGKDCWFFKSGDAEDLKRKIKFLVRSPKIALKERKKTADFIKKNYSSKLMAEKIREQIEKIL